MLLDWGVWEVLVVGGGAVVVVVGETVVVVVVVVLDGVLLVPLSPPINSMIP